MGVNLFQYKTDTRVLFCVLISALYLHNPAFLRNFASAIKKGGPARLARRNGSLGSANLATWQRQLTQFGTTVNSRSIRHKLAGREIISNFAVEKNNCADYPKRIEDETGNKPSRE